MSSRFKTKMADEVGEKSVTSNGVSNENQSNKENNSSLERRYSLQEANEIGKEVLQSIQSSLMPKVESGLTGGLEDPYIKAWKYMEESNVLLMLEILLTKLVFERPEVPVQFMADEIQNMKGKDLGSYQAYKEGTAPK